MTAILKSSNASVGATEMSEGDRSFESREGVPTMNAKTIKRHTVGAQNHPRVSRQRTTPLEDQAAFDREIDSLARRARPRGLARIVLFVSLAMLRWAGRRSVVETQRPDDISEHGESNEYGENSEYDAHTRAIARATDLQHREHGFALLAARVR